LRPRKIAYYEYCGRSGPIRTPPTFWFLWLDFHSDTDVYGM
jgi:hypothetical protein